GRGAWHGRGLSTPVASMRRPAGDGRPRDALAPGRGRPVFSTDGVDGPAHNPVDKPRGPGNAAVRRWLGEILSGGFPGSRARVTVAVSRIARGRDLNPR